MRWMCSVLLALVLLACEVKPEPLRFGTDACYSCKMTLMDNRFGSEIVNNKGKVYKFDDLNCMLNFYHGGQEAEQDMAHIMVIDFSAPGELIDARHAWYVKSENLRTPMASGVAAFSSEEALRGYKEEWKGILMSWGEVNTQFK